MRRLPHNVRPPRRGITLIICLFVAAMMSVTILGMLNSITSQLTAQRHTAEYERALYLAGAGVHHALAEIEADPSWTAGIPDTPPSGDRYSATVVPVSGTVVVTGVGISGDVTRRLEVTVDLGG